MFVLRPVRMDDLHEVKSMAENAGLVSLPNDLSRLQVKIEHSMHSFNKEVEVVRDEHYYFIMEDMKTRQICGISGIKSRTGVSIPIYYYRIDKLNPLPSGLNAPSERRILIPIQFNHHPSEIGSLYLKPEYRRDGLGRLLSLARFLFMADQRKRFKNTLIAVLRGFIDKEGHCPFWDDIGKKYLDMKFKEAFHYFVDNRQEYFTKVLPQFPVYVGMLSKEAQGAIGEAHEHAKPAMNMLMQEGFKKDKYLDVFDGGPTLEADIKDIRCMRDSHVVTIKECLPQPLDSDLFIITNNNIDFRACYGNVKLDGKQAIIPINVAKGLNVHKGDSIRFVSAKFPYVIPKFNEFIEKK